MESRPKVLILDDDVLTLELYSRELGSGYQVVTSESVQDTRRHLQQQTPDLMIIEPATDKTECWLLLRELQQIDNPPAVVVCSVEDENRERLGQDIRAYLVKPVLPTTLHTVVDQIFSKKSLHPTLKLEEGA